MHQVRMPGSRDALGGGAHRRAVPDAVRVSPLSRRPAPAALVLLALVLGARAVAAQDATEGVGSIRGSVYDSLLHSPLIRAEVWVVGTSHSTLTDPHGRYTLDGVPGGPRVVAFGRPDLDSLGLHSFAARVTVTPSTVMTVPLAVPSHDTYWRAACGTARSRVFEDSGLVFGTVTDAESRHRIAGARVTLSWISVERDRRLGWVINHPSAELVTDSLGSYYACGVPVEYLMSARVRVGDYSSGIAELLVDIRGIARRDLSVSREVVAAAGDSSGTRRRGLATVAGTVRGERGGVLPGAYASLDGVDEVAEVDSAGRFVLRDLPSGTQILMVRRVGYFASRQAVDLRNRDTTQVDVALSEATVLDTLRVTATPLQAEVIEGIDLRRRSGFGYLVGPAEVRQRPSVRSLFDGVPSMHVEGSPLNFTLWVRSPVHLPSGPASQGEGLEGFCRPQVYIDGWLADEEQLSSMMPEQILAVEVYPRQTAGLGRYMSVANNCGVVLVWTKWVR